MEQRLYIESIYLHIYIYIYTHIIIYIIIIKAIKIMRGWCQYYGYDSNFPNKLVITLANFSIQFCFSIIKNMHMLMTCHIEI